MPFCFPDQTRCPPGDLPGTPSHSESLVTTDHQQAAPVAMATHTYRERGPDMETWICRFHNKVLLINKAAHNVPSSVL